MAPKVFVKVSGDCFTSDGFLDFVDELMAKASRVVICVGGGTQINDALRKEGFEVSNHGPLGREFRDERTAVAERDVATRVLKRNKNKLEELLMERSKKRTTNTFPGLSKTDIDIIIRHGILVMIPVLVIEGVECHVNGDQLIRTFYHGFDELYVITTKERREKKVAEFSQLPKVKIIGI